MSDKQYQRVTTSWHRESETDDLVVGVAQPGAYAGLSDEDFTAPAAGIVAINDDRTIEVIDAQEYERRTGEEWG